MIWIGRSAGDSSSRAMGTPLPVVDRRRVHGGAEQVLDADRCRRQVAGVVDRHLPAGRCVRTRRARARASCGLLIPRQLVRQQHRHVEAARGRRGRTAWPRYGANHSSSVASSRASPSPASRAEDGAPRRNAMRAPQALCQRDVELTEARRADSVEQARRPSPGPRSAAVLTSADGHVAEARLGAVHEVVALLVPHDRVAHARSRWSARPRARPRPGRRPGGCERWCGCRRGRRRRRTARGPVGRPCRPTHRRRCAAGTDRPGCGGSPTRSG